MIKIQKIAHRAVKVRLLDTESVRVQRFRKLPVCLFDVTIRIKFRKGKWFCMNTVFLSLSVLFGIVIIWFLVAKRPIYEAFLISFIVLLFTTGTWGNVKSYVTTGLSSSLLYSMVTFVALSVILNESGIIDSCVSVILSLLGRVRGGAGYAAVLASSFVGALSGSGPGNVMVTGTITIPAMKRSGFPPELAGNIESNASYLGNMIPPSSNIIAAWGAFTALYPESEITTGQFWVVLWGISIWFILQRIFMVWFFCVYYNVSPMAQEDIPSIRGDIRSRLGGIFLPMVILLPFILDYFFKSSFFLERLGETGAKYFSSSLLLFIPGVTIVYVYFIASNKTLVHPRKMAQTIARSVSSIAPATGVCLIGYMVGALFKDINAASTVESFILSVTFGKLGMVLFCCALACMLGMVIPGSSLVVIFGSVFITALSSVSINPLFAAAMLPCIFGVMCGITPPLGLGMYAGMSLSGASFGKAFRNNLWWVAAQFIMEVLVLMGFFPIIGL